MATSDEKKKKKVIIDSLAVEVCRHPELRGFMAAASHPAVLVTLGDGDLDALIAADEAVLYSHEQSRLAEEAALGEYRRVFAASLLQASL